jgi:hypothetical protein
VRDPSSGEKSFTEYNPKDVGLTQLVFTGDSVRLIDPPTFTETIFGEGEALDIMVSDITVTLCTLEIEALKEKAIIPAYMVSGKLESPPGIIKGVIRPVYWSLREAAEVIMMSDPNFLAPFHFYIERETTPSEKIHTGKEQVFYKGMSNAFKPKKGVLTARIVPLRYKIADITPDYAVELPLFGKSRRISFKP